MTIKEFVDAYKAKSFMNTPQGVQERVEWIRSQLDIKSYIPFREKRQIAEMVVEQNIEIVDGIKKYDSIDGYVSLIVASIATHTSLEFSDDPVEDYDLLAKHGLLQHIIAEFQGSHDEIDIILKMALAQELEDNQISVMIGRFLNKIIEMFGSIEEAFKDGLEGLNLSNIFGEDIKVEDLTKLIGMLDKLK